MPRPKPTSQLNGEVFKLRKFEPESLEREIVKTSQVRKDENTIVWGELDALPLVILDAINKSPTTTTCLGKVSNFMRGAGFSDTNLMKLPVDQDGTTLYDLHSEICDYMAKMEGFAVRFTFDGNYKITNAFLLPIQHIRFVKPEIDKNRNICKVKYNPYFGTKEYNAKDTECYHLWNPKELESQMNEEGNKFKGQVYFFGTVRAPYNFYPVPKYWAGQHWIYVDGYLQSLVKHQLDNGFFQSVLLNMIGDPTQNSKNPKYIKEEIGTDGTKRTKSTKTVGEEFSEMMSQNFSGHDKAGKAMTLWSMNKDQTPTIQAFPTNYNVNDISGTSEQAIRGITIATEVQAILANLPQQASSLGSDGDSMRMAVELMYGRVKDSQNVIEAFYNNVLLPNLANPPKEKVSIVQLQPLSGQIQVPDNIWEWMNDEEKAAFVEKNLPQVKVIRQAPVTASLPDTAQTPSPDQSQAGPQILTGMNLRDLDKLLSIAARFQKGKISQQIATEALKEKGLTDSQIQNILFPEEEAIA